MARRAPNNPRYQKYTGPEGKTRKSAAAAKPKNASSGSGSKSSSKKSSSGNKSTSKTSALAMRNPDTAEFKAYRRQWWIGLIVGLALTAVSWALQVYVTAPWARTAQAVTLGMAYASIGFAFYIDWKKMRPLRKEAYEAAKSGKAPKSAAEKPSKADAKADSKAAKSKNEPTDTGTSAE